MIKRLGVLALLVVLLAGCSPQPMAVPVAQPAVSWSEAPRVPESQVVPQQPEPIGWKYSDIPTFPPAPVPVPITLPTSGPVPFLGRIPTEQKVAFLTIDDGYVKTSEAPKLIAAAHIPVTLFLTVDAVRDNPGYFTPMLANGAVIEDHTVTHTELRGRSAAFQHREICGAADQLGKWYHRRPVLFRPPFGDKDQTTLRVSRECGMRAALFWRETVHKGKVRYQEGTSVQPGDIILMHFRPAFVQDFLAALKAIHKAGLTPALLQDYLPGASDGAAPTS